MTATTHYGPYDVTDYLTWKAALDTGVSSGSGLTSVTYGSRIIFTETAGLRVSDDGTYIKISFGTTDLLKIRKSDGQLIIAGGLTTDATL